MFSGASKAEYLPVNPASYMSVEIVKLFVAVTRVPSPSANHPMVLNGNLKKGHAVIQRSADDWGHSLQPANRHEAELPNHS